MAGSRGGGGERRRRRWEGEAPDLQLASLYVSLALPQQLFLVQPASCDAPNQNHGRFEGPRVRAALRSLFITPVDRLHSPHLCKTFYYL